MEKVPITRLGYERLYWQLQYMKRYVRREVAEDLAAARAHGITINNLEWRTAREKQYLVESRIQGLEEMLASCEVVVSPLNPGRRVCFGLWVRIVNTQTGRKAVYQMVGPYESDVSAGRLSIYSPVGRELIGREVGDRVTVYAPGGQWRYQVVEVLSEVEEW